MFPVLIESDWNLKCLKHPMTISSRGINRIRLEFKGWNARTVYTTFTVLIESDWNLKRYDTDTDAGDYSVLIESDWNLKKSGTEVDDIEDFKY